MSKKGGNGWGLSSITNTISSAVNGHSNGHKASEAEKEAFVPATTGDVFSGGRCVFASTLRHRQQTSDGCLGQAAAFGAVIDIFCTASCMHSLCMHAIHTLAPRLFSGCKCAAGPGKPSCCHETSACEIDDPCMFLIHMLCDGVGRVACCTDAPLFQNAARPPRALGVRSATPTTCAAAFGRGGSGAGSGPSWGSRGCWSICSSDTAAWGRRRRTMTLC